MQTPSMSALKRGIKNEAARSNNRTKNKRDGHFSDDQSGWNRGKVDSHHTIEDTGIVLGQAIAAALGEKKGIKRYGSFLLPMDETLAMCAVDLSGRPYLNYQAEFTVEKLGTLDTEMIREFFYAVSYSAAMNLHLKIVDGGNNHHMAEALFKAFGKALDMATMEEPRMNGVWSTKGSL